MATCSSLSNMCGRLDSSATCGGRATPPEAKRLGELFMLT